MAEALTRPKRSRRGKAPDPRERELKRLKLSVCDDTGFRLHLATYDQPRRRDELIARVIKDAEAEKVRITRLDLAEGSPETNLVGLLRAHLASTEPPRGWRQAVMVTGIEQRLDYARGPEGFAFLHQANLLRDALPEAAPVPVVLWLSRMASAALPAEAPDLWHWRAANFDFTGDEAPRLALLRELTTYRQEDDGGLSGEQRRGRIRMLQDLLAELERGGPPKSKRQATERAGLLLELGVEEWRRSAEVMPHLGRALEVFREIGDQRGEGTTLAILGLVYADLGEVGKAIGYYEQHLVIAREIGDREGEGRTLGNLGLVYADLGEVGKAIGYYEQALAIAREIGDRRGEGNALGNLGGAYAYLGEVGKAIGYYEQHLVIVREIGDRWGEGNTLGNLGLAYADLGEVGKAIGYYEQHLVIAREIGDREGEGRTLGNLGAAYAYLGEVGKAIGYYEQALAIAREIGDRQGEGSALGNLGNAHADLGEVEKAIGYYEQALVIAREIGDRRGEGNSLGNLGIAYADLGEVGKAIDHYEQHLVIAREIGDRRGEGFALGNLGVGYAGLGEVEKATAMLQQAKAIGERIGNPRIVQNATQTLERLSPE